MEEWKNISPLTFPKIKRKLGLLAFAKSCYILWWNPRSCPAIMFLLEGFSKTLLIVIIATLGYAVISYINTSCAVIICTLRLVVLRSAQQQ